MEDPIKLTMPRSTAQLIHKVLKIALKPHDLSQSPVHIVEELRLLDKDLLKQLEEELSRNI